MNEMVRVEQELLRGAGVLSVLKLLEQKDMYGYELAEALDRQSEGVLAMGHSTLYPMLYNLESKKLIRPSKRQSEGGRTRKYYALTPEGREWLKTRESQWSRLVHAMAKIGVVREAGEVQAGGEG
jgi:PadR family transcriptional regulator PadR